MTRISHEQPGAQLMHVVDLDTNERIPDVIWADLTARQYCKLSVDDRGRHVRDGSGAFRVSVFTARIQVRNAKNQPAAFVDGRWR